VTNRATIDKGVFRVTEVLFFAYLCGWGLAAPGLYLASRRLSSKRTAPPHPLPLSILAGGLWPLILLGVVEIGSIVAAAKPCLIAIPGYRSARKVVRHPACVPG
jgi:hypothetical protein